MALTMSMRLRVQCYGTTDPMNFNPKITIKIVEQGFCYPAPSDILLFPPGLANSVLVSPMRTHLKLKKNTRRG